MPDIRRIDDQISVAPQLLPEELAEVAALGFKAVVNNRPDDEEPGQPSDVAMREAAEAAGLAYTAIPITHAGFSHPQIDAMAAALKAADGPVLAYCRSGTRSCNLWALSAAKAGGDPEAITEKGAEAGYSLTGLRPMLDALSGRA
ncbi:TIGR01244 family phosphatase [Sphingomonas spermidinifaciens]|uniref:TIGR01244 family phosphatase n=1 Tax=Sphingomonas spermidinifaciens TaxID=1141889 RepID=A0A2A4B2Q0_9SPHN|nr:TIGR01244 family sulfur transferase [Sphingomonas spermidinifaciens]PCD02337.1 TIGR01244 family phosphatase [Sphingomonas spermidinifaciens]